MELGVVALVVAALIVLTRVFRMFAGPGEEEDEVVTSKDPVDPSATLFERLEGLHESRDDLPGLQVGEEHCLVVGIEPRALLGPYDKNFFQMNLRVGDAHLCLDQVTWGREGDGVLSGDGFLEPASLEVVPGLMRELAQWLGVPEPLPSNGGEVDPLYCYVEYLGHGLDVVGRRWHVLRIEPEEGITALHVRVDWTNKRAQLVMEGSEAERRALLCWLAGVHERDVLERPSLGGRTPLVRTLSALPGSNEEMEAFAFLDDGTLLGLLNEERSRAQLLLWRVLSESPEVVAEVGGGCEGFAASGERVAMVMEHEQGSCSVVLVELSVGGPRELMLWEDATIGSKVLWSPDARFIAVSLWHRDEEAEVVVLDMYGSVEASTMVEGPFVWLQGWDEEGLWWGTEEGEVSRWEPKGGVAPRLAGHSTVLNARYEVVALPEGLVTRQREDGAEVSRRRCWSWGDVLIQQPDVLDKLRWVGEQRLWLPLDVPVLFDVARDEEWVVLDTDDTFDHVYYTDLVSHHGVLCTSANYDEVLFGTIAWPQVREEEGLW